MNTLASEQPIELVVTPLATPAFSAPARPAAHASDADDPDPVVDESASARAERPSPIPHVAPQGC